MDFLGNFNLWGGGFTGWLLPFLFVLTVVVFFHELGHFLVARWCGVRVLVFSVGFGPELCGFNDRHGTRWKLSAIPLGGYVKFFGDENAASVPDPVEAAKMSESDKRESFHHQKVLNRAAIVAAGPIANFILAIVIFSAVFMFYGKQSTTARVDTVQPGSAAAAAGFQPGDVVLDINGRKIVDFGDMQRIVGVSPGQELAVTVDRAGSRVTLKATPTLRESTDRFGNVHRLGVLGITRAGAAGEIRVEKVGPLDAVVLAADKTWFIVEQTMRYLGRLFAGSESAENLSGPVGIAHISGQIATLGFGPTLDLAGLLSVSIGLLNLFPIPLLDGGHLLFYLIEAVRGRPLSERVQEAGFRVGLALVLMLMVFTTFNDIVRLWTRLWTS